MSKILVVQQVHTYWTKAARGGENAVRRNAVPESAKLPVQRVDRKGLIVMHHRLTYGGDFSQPYEKIHINPTLRPLTIGCVTIHSTDEGAIATFRYDRGCAGAPDRGWARKTMLLTANEWGQFAYNGRFVPAYDGNWWYEKMVVNVGLFEQLTSGLFTREEPTYRFTAMGDLF
ncbi:MAG: hypothetical protein JWL77_582 [Chthonomonadaceae bacterium]|nr:hypothetical protein [Chthonomonadaceae bacterium]